MIQIKMHSFLYIGNQEDINSKIDHFIKEKKLKVINFPVQKIEESRDLKKFLSTPPTQKTVFILENVDTSSEEALNSLLKLIEEPPTNTFFILTSRTVTGVLPTIVSRCEIVKVFTTKQDLVRDYFFPLSANEKINLINKIKIREDAIIFFKNIIEECEDILKEKKDIKKWIRILSIANQSYINIKANGNIGLNLKNFLIQTQF